MRLSRRQMLRLGAAAGVLAGAPRLAAAGAPASLIETPMFEEAVAEGLLPPVEERLPREPMVVDLAGRGREAGLHGGTITSFIGRARDVRYMAAWGYARLVGYSHDYRLAPDLLREVEESADGRAFTLHLRRGHRWSDGHPFTTEDLRYWWEDVALHPGLSPVGPPVEMLVGGERPVVEVIDETTIRYVWPGPNPRFLPALAQARPLYIYRPAHYMRQYHADHAPMELIEPMVAQAKARSWAELHNRMDDLYGFRNPDLPVLQPWRNTSPPNGQRFVLERNAFYHRVDPEGRQLPYVDIVELEVASSGLVPAKATMGEADLQVRSLGFSDAPVLKRAEAAGGFVTRLWRSGAASEIALYPNLTHADPVWRAVFQDVRVRRALSLALSRKAINKVLYFGLAEERAVAALEESPFFDPEHATAWARLDLDEANRLLDAAGLDRRDGAGFRLLPDGRRMQIVVEGAGERREEEDALGIVAATWAQAGVRLLVKFLDRDILRNRAYAGSSMMVCWFGWNNGVPTPDAAPVELAPISQATFSWPRWGQFHETGGAVGEAPTLPEARRLMELYGAWSTSTTREGRAEAWREMLAIHAEQVFAIGTVSRAPVPVVANARLRNVPDEALYAWDPGAQLGIHRIDEFWFGGDPDGQRAEAGG